MPNRPYTQPRAIPRPHVLMARALPIVLRNALTDEWQSASALRNAVSTKAMRPSIRQVETALAQLRRDGVAWRDTDHQWRRAWT